MSAIAPSEPLVQVEGLHTYYGKSHILHGVTLEVGRGEVVGLIGRNGVGKSTTLKTIMGLVNARQGEIRLEGSSITHEAPHRLARRGIGYVPEDRRIFRLLTVMENLRTGFDRQGVTEERKKTLLDKVFAYFPVLAERRDPDECVMAPVHAFIALPPRQSGGPCAHARPHAELEQARESG